jgi:hypothetical protein
VSSAREKGNSIRVWHFLRDSVFSLYGRMAGWQDDGRDLEGNVDSDLIEVTFRHLSARTQEN